MKTVIFFCFFLTHILSAEIYDCFLFFNEIELLKLRFHELNDYVDHFVLVEAKDTFSGKDKPLYFEENKHLFKDYLDKVIHVVVEKTPKFGSNPWPREHYQRNQILKGLYQCRKDDIILVSDVDEIVKGQILHDLINCLDKQTRPIVGCDCDFYRWFFNRKDPTKWTGTAIVNYKTLQQLKPQGVRNLREKFYVFNKGGWHFSNMGGHQTFLEKVASFSHYRECSYILDQSKEEIYESLKGFLLVEIDESFPRYIIENYDELARKNFFDFGYYQ